MRVAVFGAGLVGRRTARLLATDAQFEVELISQKRPIAALDGVIVGAGWLRQVAAGVDIVVLATESAHQLAMAKELVRAGIHVISTADDPLQVERLWNLEDLAVANQATIVVGAAASPGISTLLATYLARGLADVSTIRTAQFGTGGPACAREHHRAMSSAAREVQGGLLRAVRGGSGRELVWFPEPVGAADCYRAGLADPFLLHQHFPAVTRIESRQAATRRDRVTARLPMLRPPHPEGLVGAVWAEVRGRVDGRVEHRTMAATGPQATGAAAMAAAFCWELADSTNERGDRSGIRSAASWENPVSLLQHVSKGVHLWAYDSSQIETAADTNGQIQVARKWILPGENPAVATFC